MTHNILVSVIVVNWNVCDLLRACISSIYRHNTNEHYELEVIVVDNASSDGSVEMIEAEFKQVNLYRSSENLGFVGGCNIGYGLARGSYIFLLNPDARLEQDTIGFFLGKMASIPNLGAVGCRMVDDYGRYRQDSGGYFPTLASLAWNYLFLDYFLPGRWKPDPQFLENDPSGELYVEWISGADLFLRNDALKGKLFDSDIFMFGEDMDLCHRLADNGFRVLYCSEQTIIHHQGQSFLKQSSPKVLASIHKGPRLFYRKYHGKGSLFFYDLVFLVGYCIRWPLYSCLALFDTGNQNDYRKRAEFSRMYLFVVCRFIFGISK